MNGSAIFDDIADIIGTAAADRLFSACKGRAVYISRKPCAALQELIGPKNAAALCDCYRGESLLFPVLHNKRVDSRQAAVIADRRAGLSGPVLAVKHGYSLRQIWNILKRSKAMLAE